MSSDDNVRWGKLNKYTVDIDERRAIKIAIAEEACRDEVLVRQVGHSLDERTAIMNSLQTVYNMTNQRLSEFYAAAKVRKKIIKNPKFIPENTKAGTVSQERKIAETLCLANVMHRRVVWMDEVQFGSSVIQKMEWTLST